MPIIDCYPVKAAVLMGNSSSLTRNIHNQSVFLIWYKYNINILD